jgi:small neutral amino acid transporter SnatA (MarC family)
LLGAFVLVVFGLSTPVVQVAGGAVVCALAWKVLGDMPKPVDVASDPVHAKVDSAMIAPAIFLTSWNGIKSLSST